jgi:hypothetical protein
MEELSGKDGEGNESGREYVFLVVDKSRTPSGAEDVNDVVGFCGDCVE